MTHTAVVAYLPRQSSYKLEVAFGGDSTFHTIILLAYTVTLFLSNFGLS